MGYSITKVFNTNTIIFCKINIDYKNIAKLTNAKKNQTENH